MGGSIDLGWREKLALQAQARLEPRICRRQPPGGGDALQGAGAAVHDLRHPANALLGLGTNTVIAEATSI